MVTPKKLAKINIPSKLIGIPINHKLLLPDAAIDPSRYVKQYSKMGVDVGIERIQLQRLPDFGHGLVEPPHCEEEVIGAVPSNSKCIGVRPWIHPSGRQVALYRPIPLDVLHGHGGDPPAPLAQVLPGRVHADPVGPGAQ